MQEKGSIWVENFKLDMDEEGTFQLILSQYEAKSTGGYPMIPEGNSMLFE